MWLYFLGILLAYRKHQLLKTVSRLSELRSAIHFVCGLWNPWSSDGFSKLAGDNSPGDERRVNHFMVIIVTHVVHTFITLCVVTVKTGTATDFILVMPGCTEWGNAVLRKTWNLTNPEAKDKTVKQTRTLLLPPDTDCHLEDRQLLGSPIEFISSGLSVVTSNGENQSRWRSEDTWLRLMWRQELP